MELPLFVLVRIFLAGFKPSGDAQKEKVFDALEWLAAMSSHMPNKRGQIVKQQLISVAKIP